MPTKQQLEDNVPSVIAKAENSTNPKEQFCIIWTGTVKPALELVKNFTGPKIDEQINKLEKAADNLCDGTNLDVSNYCNTWNTFHLKSLLKMIQLFTGPKVDNALNKFIDISDNLCV